MQADGKPAQENDRMRLCSEKDHVCLDLHHMRDKHDNVAELVRAASIRKILLELPKCIVVCSNCHRKLHAGVIPSEKMEKAYASKSIAVLLTCRKIDFEAVAKRLQN